MGSKPIVFSDEALQIANWAMVMALECKNRLIGTTYVIEDGRITEIHEKKKVIKEKTKILTGWQE